MDAHTLAHAMGNALPDDEYAQLAPTFTAAMADAGCTTVARAAMWCAQLGHESLGLRYMEELADGSAYEGRADLGNVQAGDGRLYKGRGPIQVTGRANYTACSRWAAARGLVSSPTFFVDQPEQLALPRFGFVGAVWYWVAARPQLNALADAGDIAAATRAINGGTNGLAARTSRYQRCLSMGAALLAGAPAPTSPTPEGDWFDMATKDDLRAVLLDTLQPWLDPASPAALAQREDVGFAADQIMTALGVDRDSAPRKLAPADLAARELALRDDVVYAVQQIARIDRVVTAAAASPSGGAIDYDALARALLAHLGEITGAHRAATADPAGGPTPPQ